MTNLTPAPIRRRHRLMLAIVITVVALQAAAIIAPRLARGAEMEPIVGRATVEDGDTITIGDRTIRLQGIDAPEGGQTCEHEDGSPRRCGREAADALDRMIGGRVASCAQDDRDDEDNYGRALAICRVGGRDVGLAMIEAGMAVAYRRYLTWPDGEERPHRADYLAAEQRARRDRAGLWAGRFDLPETWRRAHRNGGRR